MFNKLGNIKIRSVVDDWADSNFSDNLSTMPLISVSKHGPGESCASQSRVDLSLDIRSLR